jgi:mycothiol system anti-sigma-R factor
MLCNDVKRVVYFFLDGTLGETKQQDFKKHLNLCPECEQRMRLHSRLRDFVKRRMSGVTAPERFKQRLTRSIRAFRAEWS